MSMGWNLRFFRPELRRATHHSQPGIERFVPPPPHRPRGDGTAKAADRFRPGNRDRFMLVSIKART
jgi:hypothetical protein